MSEGNRPQLISVEKENTSLKFQNKQYIAQVRRLERECLAKEKQLRELKHCGACKCLEKRTKSQTFTSAVKDFDIVSDLPPELARIQIHPDLPDLLRLQQTREQELQDEINRIKLYVAQLQAELANAKEEIRKKNTELTSMNQMYCGSTAARLAERDREIVELNQKISELDLDRQQLLAKLHDAETKLGRERDQMAQNTSTLSSNVQVMDSRLSSLEIDLHQMQTKNTSLRAEVDNLELQLRLRDTQIRNNDMTISRLNEEKREMRLQLDRLVAREKDLQSEIAYLHSTKGVTHGVATDPLRRSCSDHALNNFVCEDSVPGPSRSTITAARPKKSALGGTRTNRTFNRYCPVCRMLHKGLQTCREIRQATNTAGIGTQPQTSVSVPESDQATYTVGSGPQNATCSLATEPYVSLLQDRIKTLSADLQRQQVAAKKLENEIQMLRQEKRLLESDRANVRRLHDQSKGEVTRLKQQIVDLQRDATVMFHHRSGFSEEPAGTSSPLRDEVARLRKDVDFWKQRYQESEGRFVSERSRLQTALDLAQSRVAQLLTENAELSASCDTVHAERQRLKDYCRELERSNQQLRNLFAQHHSPSAGADTTANVVTANTLRDLQLELNLTKRQISDLESEKRRLEALLDQRGIAPLDMKECLKAKDQEITRLRNAIASLETEYNTFRRNLADHQAQLQRLQRDVHTANSLREQAQQERQTLLMENRDLQTQLGRTTDDLQNRQRDLELALREQDHIRERLQQYVNEVEAFERLLSEKENERLALLRQYEASILENGQLQAKRASSQSKAEENKFELEQAHQLLSHLREENEFLKGQKQWDENELYRTEIASLQESLRQLQRIPSDLQKQNETLQRQLSEVRAILSTAESEKLALSMQSIDLQTQLSQMEKNILEVQADLGMAQVNLKTEQDLVRNLQHNLEAGREQDVHRQMTIDRLEASIADLKRQLVERETQLLAQGREIENLRSRLREALNGKL